MDCADGDLLAQFYALGYTDLNLLPTPTDPVAAEEAEEEGDNVLTKLAVSVEAAASLHLEVFIFMVAVLLLVVDAVSAAVPRWVQFLVQLLAKAVRQAYLDTKPTVFLYAAACRFSRYKRKLAQLHQMGEARQRRLLHFVM